MTQHNAQNFINYVDDTIAAGWPHVKMCLLRDWSHLSESTIANINGWASLLNSALCHAYNISQDKAERITLCKGRKSMLVSLLQHRFMLSRSKGWLQVERF